MGARGETVVTEETRLPYSHQSTSMWDMWIQEHKIEATEVDGHLFLKQKSFPTPLRLGGLLIDRGIPENEAHLFDYFEALGEKLLWSTELNKILAEAIGADAINGLLAIVLILHETEF
jgi:hypothetical protein